MGLFSDLYSDLPTPLSTTATTLNASDESEIHDDGGEAKMDLRITQKYQQHPQIVLPLQKIHQDRLISINFLHVKIIIPDADHVQTR